MARNTAAGTEREIALAVNGLISAMTPEEKLGQLTQAVGEGIAGIGGKIESEPIESLIRAGRVGSSIQVGPPLELAARIREFQRIAVEESRLGIPLFFCQDVIHGFETVFPIPLAWSCSFDMERIREAAAASAGEVACCGIMYAFAPMVDIARDPRWGRVAESAGEDPWLGGQIARAIVLGMQGEELGAGEDSLMACLKHYIGYSAAEAGRDYNTVEISDTTLWNCYLPPFKEGILAGAASVMTAFNVMNGVPMTANGKLIRGLLRGKLGFGGIVISDYAAVSELIAHGAAENEAEAAKKALEAGLEIEMATPLMLKHVIKMMETDKALAGFVDDAARRVLTYKYRMGIMADPYKYLREDKIASVVFSAGHLEQSRGLARRSAVLLKNNGALPMSRAAKTALIGPFADSPDLCGCWSFSTRRGETVTIAQGLREKGVDVAVEEGCAPLGRTEGGVERAVRLAEQADIVLLALGETSVMSGEACSMADIRLPECQRELAAAVAAVGKPVVLLLTNGRPMLLDWFDGAMDAILEIWALGSQAGAAVADLLVGDCAPTGRLTMSFPRGTGQIPLYYNALPTGRPYTEGSGEHFLSKYLDSPNSPLYPFGYGLTYTSFEAAGLRLSASRLEPGGSITAEFSLKNTGDRRCEATVQFYIRDCSASISRPVKELKGFVKTELDAGEEGAARFEITEPMLRFYGEGGTFASEPGRFVLMAGFSSADGDLTSAEFYLT